MVVKYGKTWWGKEWLNAIKDVDYSNRIPRGKTYANTGKVYDVDIKNNIVTAKVKGNYSPYYNVSLMFKSFSEADKEIIAEVINKSPTLLASLLNHELPPELNNKLEEVGIELFPKSWNDLTADCNCPDFAHPCKHIAGLIYKVSEAIDKDPFLVFKLHNCDLNSLIGNIKEVQKVPKVKQFFKKTKYQPNEDVDEINFSNITDLGDSTFLMLDEKPIFYDKDFKDILSKIYTRFSKYARNFLVEFKKETECYKDSILLKATSPHQNNNFDKNEDFNEFLDRFFNTKWSRPDLWGDFKINIGDDFRVNEVYLGEALQNPFIFDNDEYLERIIVGFLNELNYTPKIHNYTEKIRFLDLVFKFCLKLIENKAILPKIYQTKGKKYIIRWNPAVYDREVKKILDNLYKNVPDNFVTFNKKSLNKKQQVDGLISILLNGLLDYFTEYGLTQQLENQKRESIFRMFLGETVAINESDALLIEQWLSNFSIKHRDYDLFLQIEEEGEDSFTLDLKASIDLEEMRSVKDIISDKTNYKITDKKIQLLSDVYLIKQHLPAIEDSINFKKNIKFNLDEFKDFFFNILPLFDIMGISVILPKSLQKIYSPQIKLEINSNRNFENERGYLSLKDFTDFDWRISIGSKDYSKKEFEKLVKDSEGLVKIANEYVILDEKQVKSLIKRINKLPDNLNQNDLMTAILTGEFKDVEVDIDDELKEMFDSINRDLDISVPAGVNANLRPYQKTGFSWLVQNINTGFGSILADDMGLGKTLQVLTAIEYLKNEGSLEKEKVLIVMPSGLLLNWKREIEKFTPNLNAVIYHGTGRKLPKDDYDIVLTSYGVVRQDVDKLKKHKWFLTVIDEAQAIKNPLSKQSKAVKAIKSKHRIALSGTPVENRLSEYWSIFDFTNKGYLSSARKFTNNFIKPIEKDRDDQTLKRFRKMTEPFILRRLKSDKSIINDLPDKIVNDVYCNLTPTQAAIYEQTLNSLMNKIEDEQGINRKGIIFKLINSLKQICNHPAQFSKDSKFDIAQSGKMEVLINLLENIIANDEKVLIFTQYVAMGEIIQKLVENYFNTEVLFLHGSLSKNKKDELVREFQENSQKKIFIISLKAGGTGLNLTAARNVIHYDLWWNPAVENQATDRAYRIGQKENVMVYRFITSGTFEEKINEMIHEKQELADLTVSNEEKFITEMDNKELEDLLKLRD